MLRRGCSPLGSRSICAGHPCRFLSLHSQAVRFGSGLFRHHLSLLRYHFGGFSLCRALLCSLFGHLGLSGLHYCFVTLGA